MSEVNGGDINETNEVNESKGTEEVDEDLEKELDEKYANQLNNPTNYEHKSSSDVKESDSHDDRSDVEAENENHELSDEDKAEICEETGWSKETVDMMKSREEAEIYKNADLQETEIDGRKCLIRSDIDMEQKDEFGRTNKERMENGNPPLTKNGETVELHHIGQKQDSPLAELTTQEHRGKGNDTVLHDKQKESEIDRSEFAKERKQHWESRANNS